MMDDALAQTFAQTLATTVRAALDRLDEVRLPLHILLDARFGELNENQEELLGAARDAADAIDGALRQLAEIADAARGALPVRREAVHVNDVVRAVLPLAQAAAARRGARAAASLDPMLPRVSADRARLAEALALLAEGAAAHADAGATLSIETGRDADGVWLSVAPAPRPDVPSAAAVLAASLVEAQRARIEWTAEGVRVRFA
ncbi:MAG: hypothetical protein JO180_07090 [Gemmatirosa sp.]|nr:hypothetical protein [Gemmatirosa sp.]